MQVIHTVNEMQKWAQNAKSQGQKIGLVPTMGFLHAGHLSLVKSAKSRCDQVAVSIFVNPIQFGPTEDLATYPRDLERDVALLAAEGVDVVFNPAPEEMYPGGFAAVVEITSEMTTRLCGSSRPGHFSGVTTVVSKLFNICLPDEAFFGQKDAQQLLVIEKMVRDLNFPVTIVRVPIKREADGLAMSSRNVYLSDEERQLALVLNQSLQKAYDLVKAGERNPAVVKAQIEVMIAAAPAARVDYIAVVSGEDLSEINLLSGSVLIALAVGIGKTRLIDNLIMEV
ncbi:MAG: pantoate--beta-alanine ligase [Methylocystaceae bacterium]